MSFGDALRALGGGDDDAPAARGPDGNSGSTGDAPVSVTDACRMLESALATVNDGREFEVEGEIGDCSLRRHWYFTLKDARGSKLPCAFFEFRRRADRGVVEPRLGMKVVARGRPELYTKGGRLSFVVTGLREAGVGDLHQRFEALKASLEARGWFDPSARLPLPRFARRLLVLTSGEGAALTDIVETTRQRWPGFELLLAPVPVQGDHATPRIARAIRLARSNAARLGVDAIVLARGGGSLEDLWCFNEEAVAAAIHESREDALRRHAEGGPSPVPLVSAIGHESDVSISDLVADHRASTPTQAAMILVPDAGEQGEYLDGREGRLVLLARQALERAGGRLEVSRRHELLRRPERMLEPHRRRIDALETRFVASTRRLIESADGRLALAGTRLRSVSQAARIKQARQGLADLADRLDSSSRRSLDRAARRLDSLGDQLRIVGPESVLARGYSLVVDGEGRVVRDASDLEPGDAIEARFQRGRARGRVDSIEVDEVESGHD